MFSIPNLHPEALMQVRAETFRVCLGMSILVWFFARVVPDFFNLIAAIKNEKD